MKARFLADANLNLNILTGVLRAEPSVDFATANTRALEGLGDDQVLAIAASEDRILVTHDLKTIPSHFARFIAGSRSPGVILIAQKTSVILVWTACEASEWIDRICRLPF